ncbi:MAG: transporter substrate-binding domain-containing protein [Pseudomonas sp.]|nr:transporter substrate-binding domain-containing protein [Pseudomonas sp.]
MPVVCRLWLVVLGLLAAQPLLAAQLIKVGAYHFPPYVSKPEAEQAQGLLPDLLATLNAQQSDYQFVLVPTSVTRRFRDFQSARYDLIMFESPTWGWQNTPHETFDMQVQDAEVYVAKAAAGRGQEYFSQFSGKRLALYNGYHYGFAQFNADPEYLAKQFNAVLTYSHDSNLLMVLRERADLTVVTRSYLHRYLLRYPEQRTQMLVSDRVDQVYRHQALLRPNAPISVEGLRGLLRQLRDGGQLSALYRQYDLTQSRKVARP